MKDDQNNHMMMTIPWVADNGQNQKQKTPTAGWLWPKIVINIEQILKMSIRLERKEESKNNTYIFLGKILIILALSVDNCYFFC